MKDSIKEFEKELAGKRYDVITIRTQDLKLPKVLSKNDVKNVRKILGLSQPVFAKMMGVHTITLQKWEQGKNKPLGSARRLMQLFLKRPDFYKQEILRLNSTNEE